VSVQRRFRASVQLGALTISRLFLNTGLRMVYPFLPAFARGLGVPLATLAGLVALRSYASILSPLFGPLSERFGRRVMLVVSMVLFSLGCLVIVIWPDLWAFGVTLIVVAIAKVIYDPAMQAYIGDTVVYEKRGRSIAISELSWAGAFFLGMPLVGLAITEWGWQAPFLWLAAFGIGGALVLRGLLPLGGGQDGSATNLAETWRVIRRHRVIWAAAVYITLMMAANEIILIVFGDWMETSFALTLTALGLVSAVIGGAEVTGELTTAAVVDRIGKRRFIIFTGSMTAVMYLVLPTVGLTLVIAMASLFILFLFFEMSVVGGIPLMTELVPQARGIVLSVVLAAAGLGRGLGASIGPLLWSRGDLRLNGLVSFIIMVAAVIILALWVREAPDEREIDEEDNLLSEAGE
jgi:predicted MFS family arabinose efflux permease